MRRRLGDDDWARMVAAVRILIQQGTLWLLDFGNWVFGSLIATNGVILGALLSTAPVDPAVVIATIAVALALMPAVAGFLVLRFASDMRRGNFDQIAAQALAESGFRIKEQLPSGEAEAFKKNRARLVLRYSYVLLAWTVLLTLIAVTGALWHIAWWNGAIFILTVILSPIVLIAAVASTIATSRPRRPPEGQA